jgi:hypothetical protein
MSVGVRDRSRMRSRRSIALWNALKQPDPWSILANLLYWTMLIVIRPCAVRRHVRRIVRNDRVGCVRSARAALHPTIHLPTLEWLFWNWLKTFVHYSFMPVIANAFIFVLAVLESLPPEPAARDTVGGSALVRNPRGDDSRHIHCRSTTGPVADELDILGPFWRVCTSESHLVLRD